MDDNPEDRPLPSQTLRPHSVGVLLLTVASGGLDAVGFLGLGGVFASVMTGNMVLLGLSAGHRNATLATHAALALGGYVLGVFAGLRLARGSGRTGLRRRSGARITLAAELGVLLFFTLGWELASGRPTAAAQLALAGLAAAAMGLQSAAMRVLGGSGVRPLI